MSFYQKHVFFCVNKRVDGRKSCENDNASAFREYMKLRLKDLGLEGIANVRVNTAGCLGRCAEGPLLVIYPEGVWYTYEDTTDIDAIIESHFLQNKVVHRLLI